MGKELSKISFSLNRIEKKIDILNKRDIGVHKKLNGGKIKWVKN